MMIFFSGQHFWFLSLLIPVMMLAAVCDVLAQPVPSGALKPHPNNPRYFTDSTGKAIYLTGSHVWDNFQDWGGPTPKFNYSDYLDFLKAHHHNFIRLWVGESTKGQKSKEVIRNPMRWERIGPGIANDGKPKFDLTKFDQTYFDRLRFRVLEAGKRGIYVSVMLFNGIYDWTNHPFNAANNVNRINGDLNHGGDGKEVHTLAIPKVNRLQEAYVLKVIQTVNDLGNVLYEVANEMGVHSLNWQYHIINYIRNCEKKMPKQHPIGMTWGWPGSNQALFDSPADWISPGDGDSYDSDPPASNGAKIIISDTDHLNIINTPTPEWVWKSFLRGLNPILMDVLQNKAPGINEKWNELGRPSLHPTRHAMGQTLKYAKRIDLSRMVPHGELTSTQYCLADPGSEYLVYLPRSSFRRREKVLEFFGIGKEISLNLMSPGGLFHFEWFNPTNGQIQDGGIVEGGRIQFFKSPFRGDAVLYAYRLDSKARPSK